MLFRHPTPLRTWCARALLLAGIGALCFYLIRLALISHDIAIAKAEVRCVQARAAGAAGPECEESRHGHE